MSQIQYPIVGNVSSATDFFINGYTLSSILQTLSTLSGYGTNDSSSAMSIVNANKRYLSLTTPNLSIQTFSSTNMLVNKLSNSNLLLNNVTSSNLLRNSSVVNCVNLTTTDVVFSGTLNYNYTSPVKHIRVIISSTQWSIPNNSTTIIPFNTVVHTKNYTNELSFNNAGNFTNSTSNTYSALVSLNVGVYCPYFLGPIIAYVYNSSKPTKHYCEYRLDAISGVNTGMCTSEIMTIPPGASIYAMMYVNSTSTFSTIQGNWNACTMTITFWT